MKKKSNKSIFDQFDELSANDVSENYESAKKFLEDLDVDVEKLRATGKNEFKKKIFLAKATSNQTRDIFLLDKLRNKIKESFERNARLAGDILKNALSESKASFQFRNLEKWSDDELREVLGDMDLTKLLEDLEDMDNQ